MNGENIMDDSKCRIFLKGKDKTEEIRFWKKEGNSYLINFKRGGLYKYRSRDVKFIETESKSEKKNSYKGDRFQMSEKVRNTYNYLLDVAGEIGLKGDNGNNILKNRFAKVNPNNKDSVLYSYLSGELDSDKTNSIDKIIYPFGFNLSQMEAIEKALSYKLSVIEGPPGTGKTQTILNIIANLVKQNKTVAVVSSNNSAVGNVLEKLKNNNIDFISAFLGNSNNKNSFIENQSEIPECINTWAKTADRSDSVSSAIVKITNKLRLQNKLSKLKSELTDVSKEYEHFEGYLLEQGNQYDYLLKGINSSVKVLKLWHACERLGDSFSTTGLFKRLYYRFKYGIVDKQFYSLTTAERIQCCQKIFYTSRILELQKQVEKLENKLQKFDLLGKLQECTDLSMDYFKLILARRFTSERRRKFSIGDMWQHSDKFLEQYPVILSTTYSLSSSLNTGTQYDYVIIDEASQVNIATGALSLGCAKNAVVVGDLKQLPNVVNTTDAKTTDEIFAKYSLNEAYRYKNHSLLESITELFPNVERTLLKEHYRCAPQIIEFCNKKFYNNELIILTQPVEEIAPLMVHKTAEGNHSRDNINQRQIDVIQREILPCEIPEVCKDSIGIVTPYRRQTEILQKTFAAPIEADTVDKYQGREKDVIIISTVDNKIGEFADNPNRLNVAVSRAVKKLIIVCSAHDNEGNSNLADLINYINYNNLEVRESKIYSVFDYLYGVYNEPRRKLLDKKGRKSEFDSESLIYHLILDVLGFLELTEIGVALHIPLSMLIKNKDILSNEEQCYGSNPLTHVDFLLFNKVTKKPLLVIEVDGVAYHKEGSRQEERDTMKNSILEKYGMPLLRLRTDGSNEKQKIIDKLRQLLNR